MITYTTDGIEIDHGDRDISASFGSPTGRSATRLNGGRIEIGIGENYLGAEGYERWTEINLTMEEAKALRDWFSTKLDDLIV